MGKINYYSNEIEDRLRQVDINRNDIGMTQINVLPIPDGAFDLVTDEVPVTMELDVTGTLAGGSIIVDVDGEADASSTTISAYSDFAMLTVLGTETASTGIIKPGKYLMSLGGSDSAADMPWQEHYPPEIRVTVTDQNLNAESYPVDYGANAVEIIIPENFTTVEFRLNLWFDSFVGAHSCELYPFLRLEAFEDEPFEPYKPDLQTQINELKVPDLTKKVDRLTDTVGTEGSINLFPIDKGSRADPLVVQGNNGVFYIAKGDSPSDPSMIQYYATSTETELEQEDVYETKFNDHYDFEDTGLYGDLVPDEYLFSFDVSADRQNFTTHGKFSYKIYQAQSPLDDFELIAVCEEGQTVSFTVIKEKPYILITAFAEKFEDQSWEGDYIITYPFLRHKTFETESYDIYKPSLNKQISKLDVAQDSTTAGFARLTDAVGMDGSINLFPIDKGVPSDPVTYDAGEGEFAVMQADTATDTPSLVAFSGTSDGTTETTAEYRSYFNYEYRFDNALLFGDLASGDYILSFDVLEDVGFSDVADFYFEVYANSTGVLYGDLIATCTGGAVEFTVTAAKPFITILAVAKRHAGHSWNGAEIYVVPFLRRKIFAAATRDEYKPSVWKQLAELRYQIASIAGYNETQTERIHDNAQEVTT